MLIVAACGVGEAPCEDGVIRINRAELVAQFASSAFEVVQQSRLVNAIGHESTRTYTGVAIRNVLAQHIALDSIPPTATLLALSQDGVSTTYRFEQFMAETTLLAWYEDRYNNGNRVEVTRIVIADGLAALFLQRVISLTLVLPEENTNATETSIDTDAADSELALNLPPLPSPEINDTTAMQTSNSATNYYSLPTSGQPISTTSTAPIPIATTASQASVQPTNSAATTTRTTAPTTTRTTQPTRPAGQQQPGSPPPQTGSQTIAISRAILTSQFSSAAVTQQSRMTDSIGRESTRSFTGVPIRNILAHHGINLGAVPAGATLQVTATDGVSVTLSRAEFMADTTLLAWHEVRDGNQNALSVPRLVFPSGLSGRFLQQVATITISF